MQSYASPWVVTTFKHADIAGQEGILRSGIVDEIATETAGYLGVSI